MSHWYSFERAQRELSNEYQCDMVQILHKEITSCPTLMVESNGHKDMVGTPGVSEKNRSISFKGILTS